MHVLRLSHALRTIQRWICPSVVTTNFSNKLWWPVYISNNWIHRWTFASGTAMCTCTGQFTWILSVRKLIFWQVSSKITLVFPSPKTNLLSDLPKNYFLKTIQRWISIFDACLALARQFSKWLKFSFDIFSCLLLFTHSQYLCTTWKKFRMRIVNWLFARSLLVCSFLLALWGSKLRRKSFLLYICNRWKMWHSQKRRS